MRTGAWLACKDCASVFATMKSTPESLEPIIVLTALPPPPPMPITLMRAGGETILLHDFKHRFPSSLKSVNLLRPIKKNRSASRTSDA
jgi:hypothetical protein